MKFLPLLISFTPKIEKLILEKFFDKSEIERVTISKNSRNQFYNNRDQINNKKKNSNLSKGKIFIKNIINIDKQILLTPIFLFTRIFMQGGLTDFYINYQNSMLLMIYIF